jgi:hypothetical protein
MDVHESHSLVRVVGNAGELSEGRSDDERFSCAIIAADGSEGLRMWLNSGAPNWGEDEVCWMTGDTYCAGDTKRDVTRCAVANVRRGETGSEYGAAEAG